MNLAGFTELARLGKMVDVDLWNYETENGRSIRKAYEFLMPYIATDKEWPYPELSEPANYQERFRELLGLAGQEFDQEFLESLAAKGAESGVQSVDTIYLWTGKVPGESEGKYDPIQSSNTSGNVIRLTDVTNPALIVFEPEQSLNNGAGVIICPGGGYRILAIDKEGYEVAQWLNGLGFTAFVLQYRVPNKRKEALYDIQRAIRLIRYRASLWDLDPNKLGVLGFSAGGSLSARASTGITMDSYTRLDDIDSISYRPDFAALIYPAYLDEGENSSLTPELVVNDNTPPMFIFGTADDSYGNSSLVMAAALRDNMVPVELHLLPAGGHGYGMRTGNIAAETWPVLAEAWLNKFVVNK
jgi:acetyl esterase/lipase